MDNLYLANQGASLLGLGYDIVPITRGYKYPKGMVGWQDISANQKDLDAWLAGRHAKSGVGILTKNFPAVDLDIEDEDAIQAM